MPPNQPRRRFLIAVGGAAALAGCVSQLEGHTPGDYLGRNGSGDPDEFEGDYPASERGRLLDDFTDLDPWGINVGRYDGDQDDWLRGGQSLRFESRDDGSSASVFTGFDDGLNIEGGNLSIAVKVNSDGPARLTTELLAPGRSDHLLSSRYIGRDLDGWIRIDLGYTSRRGEPDLTSISEMHINVESLEGGSLTVWLDDLRVIDAPSQGRAVLVFDNAFESHYERVYPHLADHGAAGVVPIGFQILNAPGRLDTDQARELRDAGWDIASRPDVSTPLPEMSDDDQREAIESNYEYLRGRGFQDGSQHFFAPGYRMDNTTIDIVREVHDSAVTFGGCPNANPPVGRYTLSRFNGDAGDSSRRLIQLAGDYRQSVVLGFSEIGPDGRLTDAEFLDLLEFIHEQGLEIVTLTDLIDTS